MKKKKLKAVRGKKINLFPTTSNREVINDTKFRMESKIVYSSPEEIGFGDFHL